MKIAHWTTKNGSGMHHVAEDMAKGERGLGLDSLCLNCDLADEVERGRDADIHVVHTWFPDGIDREKTLMVSIEHGMPEQTFINSLRAGQGHGTIDSWHAALGYIKDADAVVTFWDRHKFIWESLMDRGRVVDLVPMPLDRDTWKQVESRGKFAGTPSLLSGENSHTQKWCLDLLLLWPLIHKEFPASRLHIFCLPLDQHRWFFGLMSRTGILRSVFVTPNSFSAPDLRNAFASVDYYVNLGRYGDFNRMTIEAAASGCKVISYRGNPYADYWLDEGDQRVMVAQLGMIIRGDIAPRPDKIAPPDLEGTARAMLAIYERISDKHHVRKGPADEAGVRPEAAAKPSTGQTKKTKQTRR